MTIPDSIWFSQSSVGESINSNLASITETKKRGIEYVLKSNPPLDQNPISKFGFCGGRENTPFAEIVPCSYYRAEPGEVSLEITGRCSAGTLLRIMSWFKRQTIEKTNAGGETYRVFGGVDK